MSPTTITNALTVDVEEWYHVCGVELRRDLLPEERRVRRNTERLLSLFREFDVTATFFVLGSLAEEVPALVPMIAAAGHEIASHGFSHRLISSLSPEQFRDEVRRTGDIIRRQSGERPVGFRAPQWSINGGARSWAFTILREEGYTYDSSCSPLPFIGDPRAPRLPFVVETSAGPILEIPPMVTPTFLGNLPTGGGWGFRFFPLSMVNGTIAALNSRGASAVLYLHPREVDPCGPRLRLSPLKAFVAYGSKKDAAERLGEILGRYRFGPLRQLTETWQPV